MDEKEIWQSAAAMIKRYGDESAYEAGQRADQLLDEGDIEGQRTWMRIIIAIEELQKTEPEGRVH